ncbi:hypothetical protein BDV96DRAFT_595227 [Lophiotrema nucula]|uniref:DUF6594 domain-containing protein n=1 Tax=Lophiotrema nucula TaxID=690887 RepID=A0A6A5ZRD2_9PLEO|nr:hypothetical protein BDV96DRAFT_595227 [Lophiotrema nucula]
MAPSIDHSDELFDTDDIKRSDFGSKKSTDTTASASKDLSNIEKGNGEAVITTDPDELKSKIGSKKSITTVGSSTLAPTDTLSSNVGSISKDPTKKSYTPLRKNTFRLASTFSLTDSVGSVMTFRGFERVNAWRMLTLEAEIADLEKRLEQLEKEDAGLVMQTSFWEKQAYRNHGLREEEMEKLGVLLDMKLERYYDAIFRSTQIRDLQAPAPVQRTREKEVVLRSLSAIFALLFLVTAIVVLYFIDKPVARVGALCGFTIAFAIALITLTTAKRHEVFVATAAYAAVLVVFISGNLANTNYVNNAYYPYGPPVAANTIVPAQTIVQVQTQTVTMGSEIVTATATATVTAIQTAVTSVYPTTCAPSTFCAATASPSATSAAAKHGFQALPLGGQAGVGVLLAIVGIISLSWLTSLLVGGFGCFV